MKNSALVLCLLHFLFIFSDAQEAFGSENDTQKLLEDRQTNFFEAMSTKNLEQTVGYFSEQAVLHIAGMPQIEGKDAISRFFGNLFGFIISSEATPEAVELSSNGDMAYTRGKTVNTFAGPQGSSDYTGKYLLVWKKTADEWLIDVYSVSGDE